MAEITTNGVRLHLQRLTRRHRSSQLEHPVVFIHGLILDNLSSYYCTLANPVAHAGADVILYDQRGHGLSERPLSGYRLSDSVADLAGLLEALGVDGPVHLVGNSYGGTVALGFAVEYPERVASMVLIEARVPLGGWAEQMTATIRKIGSDLAAGESGRWVAQSRKHTDPTALGQDLIQHTTYIKDLLATEPLEERQLRMVTCPVRAVYGKQSDILDHAHVLDGLLPQCALTVLPDADHLVLAKATRVVRAIVLDWFTAQTMATQTMATQASLQ
ncbi:MAG: alpha/beta fold hydrolase [Pseudonocardiaceae bacterium]